MALSTTPSFSSSLPSTSKWSYDVFLSFRGEDTRNTFIAHLYPALNHKGIHTYKDDKDLERGEIISPTLLKAIEESMISIIVLSPNYASSSWCLEELTKILECKETKQQIVLPVFYHVDPSKVRKLEGSFEEALAKHQERFKEDPKVQRWKEALQEVAGLAGEHLEDGINEYEFMHKIIQWVDSKIVKSTYQLDIAEYPIGLESRLKDLNTYLETGRNEITLMIGIYGIGGVGKTTIAKAVFNSIGDQFEARCFLANVREISSREDGLVKLQEKLLRELLGNFESFYIGSVGGTNVIQHRLCSKRVLIILDDVNESHQLKGLAGDKNWFGPGSRIVITTRDQRLLTCNQVDSRYEVRGLDGNQAIQLFSWHAFKRDKPIESYVELTERIIWYAKGLPLALSMLGSALYDRSMEQWKSALEKYERSPHQGIYEILKISYDGLDDNEKDIFLDIACLFKGESVEYVTKLLDSCHFSSSIGIARLKEKCLITISHRYCDHYVEMHDLLQEMGKKIVQQESPKEAGERSRLFFHEDVRHVLEENTGTNKIVAMLLDFPGGHNKICLHPKAFGKIRNLRFFINKNAQFSARPNYLSNEIRLLDWDHYPSSSLPSNFRGDNLVIFRMHNSLIKELGGLNFKNLIDMKLTNCKFLTKIIDLSSCGNLEKLTLEDCNNLVEIHHSVGLLDKLREIFVRKCCKLRFLPKRFKLRSLSTVKFEQCSSLEVFPEIDQCSMESIQAVNYVCLDGTSIKKLPSSIENLKGLAALTMRNCSIMELPSSIVNLPHLTSLWANGLQQLNIGKVEEEDGIQSTSSIVSTGEYEIASTTPTNSSIFNDAGFSSSAIWELLQYLTLEFCCLSESNFFTYVNYFPALESLDLSGSDIVIFPPHQGDRFPKLQELYLNNCEELKEILPLPSSIVSVQANQCPSLESFALLSEILTKNYGRNFDDRLMIELYGCHKLLAIPSWEEERQLLAYLLKVRYFNIIFPGKRILNWFSYRKEAHDSNWCVIDINPPHHLNDKDKIIFYADFGFRSVGIINPRKEIFLDILVSIHDGSVWKILDIEKEQFYTLPDVSDHVWMQWGSYGKQVDVSRFRLEGKSKRMVLGSVGIHFVKDHEDNVRDDIGDHIELGSPRWYVDDTIDDDGNPYEDLELETDDENPNEDLELETNDENPHEDLELET